MSDDLVKRLREVKDWWREPGRTAEQAADRIEELEKEVKQWKQRCLSTFVEMVTLLGDTAAEKANIRAIFENVEEVFIGGGDD